MEKEKKAKNKLSQIKALFTEINQFFNFLSKSVFFLKKLTRKAVHTSLL